MIASAWAHAPSDHLHELGWLSWNFSPAILVSLVLISIAYGRGWRRMRAARSRPARGRISAFHASAFYLGVLALVLALLSPIDAFSDMLASVHMAQHTLLMMMAAPLIAVSSPGYVALWAIPMKRSFSWIFRVYRYGRPLAVWILYSVTLWLWHLPVLYEAALRDPIVHDLQHLAFFVTAFLFWRVLFEPYDRMRLNSGAGVIYLFVASLHSMILGVLMALSPTVWYRLYEERAPLYGLSALQDQQIAGTIMWMPAGIAYVVAAAVLLARLIREPARQE